MPTNFQLAEGGGMHYQPWITGGAGVGGGNGGWITGPPFTGGGGTTGGKIGTDPNIWGGGGTTNPNTGVIPGSDKDKDLKNGRIHHDEMYDHNDMWIGAEGPDVAKNADFSSGPGSLLGTAFMNALANNPVTRIENAINSSLGYVNGIDTRYGPEGADGQGESEADIEADIEASRDGGVVA